MTLFPMAEVRRREYQPAHFHTQRQRGQRLVQYYSGLVLQVSQDLTHVRSSLTRITPVRFASLGIEEVFRTIISMHRLR